MGARMSPEMIQARKLIVEYGLTPYAAAKATGLTRPAIYQAPWYKKWKEGTK